MNFVSKTALFRECSEEDIRNMARHLDFRTDKYRKGNVIFSAGNIVTDIGLVLSGSLRIEHTDLWGNKSILGITPAGDVFGESYACVPGEPMMVDAVANEDCDILFISVPKLFMPCSVCHSQNKLIQNLVIITAQKICSFPGAACTHPPKPYGVGCFPTSRNSFPHRAVIGSSFPLTASSWLTI